MEKYGLLAEIRCRSKWRQMGHWPFCFSDGKLAQLRDLAVKMEVPDMAGSGNPAFFCWQTKVTSDFSDLEQIRREHCINRKQSEETRLAGRIKSITSGIRCTARRTIGHLANAVPGRGRIRFPL